MAEEKKITIEDRFKELESTISELEKEDVSLEDAFSLYEKGMGLLKECNAEIDLVEKKVLMLSKGEAHEFQ